MAKNLNSPGYNTIPATLTKEQFNQFILPHLSVNRRGPMLKLSLYKIFTYVLLVLYTGMQWKSLPIERDQHGIPEIHYTTIFRKFNKWSQDGSFNKIKMVLLIVVYFMEMVPQLELKKEVITLDTADTNILKVKK